MTYEVWDHLLSDGPAPLSCDIPTARLAQMKAEFNYFYPMDVRCSGKDLIPNHLTFAIYNHVALFPEAKWPLGMRSNGHLLVDGEKMAKSKGNFITLNDAIAEYSADAMRLTLAVAGDGVDDANFGKDVVNQSILRLFTLKEWIDEVYHQVAQGHKGAEAYRLDGDYLFDDNVFLHSLYHLGRLCDQEYAK
jgi:leucyl-tRNA synthetase